MLAQINNAIKYEILMCWDELNIKTDITLLPLPQQRASYDVY